MPVVSIKEIASKAGVSQMTVSRVLNGKTGHSRPEAIDRAKRIRRIAKDLGYRPNLLVKGIQTGQTGTIGIVTAGGHEFEYHLICGVQAELSDTDRVPIVLSKPPRDHQGELRLLHRLIDRRVDGVIVIPSHDHFDDPQAFAEVWERQLPLVWVRAEMPDVPGDVVSTDEAQAAELAVTHLVGLGHARLGHLTGSLTTSPGRARQHAFRDAVTRHLGPIDYPWVDGDFRDGYQEARALLRMEPRPTAVFAASDYMAMGLYRAAAEMGLRVPQDLSVVGMADLSFAARMNPGLTTISQDADAIGRTAAEQLVKRINSDQHLGSREVLQVPSRLVQRASTAPPSH